MARVGRPVFGENGAGVGSERQITIARRAVSMKTNEYQEVKSLLYNRQDDLETARFRGVSARALSSRP